MLATDWLFEIQLIMSLWFSFTPGKANCYCNNLLLIFIFFFCWIDVVSDGGLTLWHKCISSHYCGPLLSVTVRQWWQWRSQGCWTGGASRGQGFASGGQAYTRDPKRRRHIAIIGKAVQSVEKYVIIYTVKISLKCIKNLLFQSNSP